MPTIRGSSITASSAGSYTLPFSALTPAVPQAGDTIFLTVGGGWAVSTAPASWDVLDTHSGVNWNGSVYARVLTSGDISTGSVSFTMAGSFDTVAALVAYVGQVAYRAVTASQNGGGSASVALASTSAVQATDHVLLFGSNRANSTDTVDKGTGVVTISGGTGGNASGVVTEYVPGAPGVFTANFAYATPGSGNYQAIIPVRDIVFPIALQVGDSVRETLGAGTAALEVGALTRETLGAGTSQLKIAAVVREVLRSANTGATQLQAAALVREVLVSSVSHGRRRQLINPM